ncbi:MAG TPA: hypothetical protein VGP52_04140 [Stellaceae bacterium]|nr:hypothetical protein [Stellaceae bacterium]
MPLRILRAPPPPEFSQRGQPCCCREAIDQHHAITDLAEALDTGQAVADDGCEVGRDSGSPVSQDYGPGGREFTGRIKEVEIAIARLARA